MAELSQFLLFAKVLPLPTDVPVHETVMLMGQPFRVVDRREWTDDLPNMLVGCMQRGRMETKDSAYWIAIQLEMGGIVTNQLLYQRGVIGWSRDVIGAAGVENQPWYRKARYEQ